MLQQPAKRTRGNRAGFSLVELMVVIVIIGLLASILVPVLSRAYKTALSTADAAMLAQISLACEAYNQVFLEYPNSYWQPIIPLADPAKQMRMAWPPPQIPAGAPANYIGTIPVLSGAAKLYASLSGFNTLPTLPTLPPLPPSAASRGCNNDLTTAPAGTWQPFDWQGRCGEITHRGIITSLTPRGTTEDKIYGPYYDANEKQQTRTGAQWLGLTSTDQMVFASRFQRDNAPSLVLGGQETGAPILYYRANPHPLDGSFDGLANGVMDPWEIYDYRDNYMITDHALAATATIPYFPTAPITQFDGTWHPLYGFATGQADVDYGIPNPNLGKDFGITRPIAGVGTIDPNTVISTLPAPLIPYNADTFILISPGPDGRYFTADDVTNFKQ